MLRTSVSSNWPSGEDSKCEINLDVGPQPPELTAQTEIPSSAAPSVTTPNMLHRLNWRRRMFQTTILIMAS